MSSNPTLCDWCEAAPVLEPGAIDTPAGWLCAACHGTTHVLALYERTVRAGRRWNAALVAARKAALAEGDLWEALRAAPAPALTNYRRGQRPG